MKCVRLISVITKRSTSYLVLLMRVLVDKVIHTPRMGQKKKWVDQVLRSAFIWYSLVNKLMIAL